MWISIGGGDGNLPAWLNTVTGAVVDNGSIYPPTDDPTPAEFLQHSSIDPASGIAVLDPAYRNPETDTGFGLDLGLYRDYIKPWAQGAAEFAPYAGAVAGAGAGLTALAPGTFGAGSIAGGVAEGVGSASAGAGAAPSISAAGAGATALPSDAIYAIDQAMRATGAATAGEAAQALGYSTVEGYLGSINPSWLSAAGLSAAGLSAASTAANVASAANGAKDIAGGGAAGEKGIADTIKGALDNPLAKTLGALALGGALASTVGGATGEDTAAQQFADEARQIEAERQQKIAEGTGKVNEAFGQFDDDYFSGIQHAAEDYYLPDISRQFDRTMRQLPMRFATRDSSAYAREAGLLEEDRARQEADYKGKALEYANNARATVEQNRGDLVQQVNAGAGVEQAADLAAKRAAAVSRPPTFSPIADLFTKFTANAANTAIARNLQGSSFGAPNTLFSRSPRGAVSYTSG